MTISSSIAITTSSAFELLKKVEFYVLPTKFSVTITTSSSS